MYKVTGRLTTSRHLSKLVKELKGIEFEGKPRYTFDSDLEQKIINETRFLGETPGKKEGFMKYVFEFLGRKYTIVVNLNKEQISFVPHEVSKLSLQNVDRCLKSHIASFFRDAASIPVVI